MGGIGGASPARSVLFLALTELVQPADAGELASGAEVLRLSSAAGRHAVVRRYLWRVAKQRPVVLLLDDAQWSLDSLGFTLRLLKEIIPEGWCIMMH